MNNQRESFEPRKRQRGDESDQIVEQHQKTELELLREQVKQLEELIDNEMQGKQQVRNMARMKDKMLAQKDREIEELKRKLNQR